MKLTTKQKQKIASEIHSKYYYMDGLSMNGWAWEFVRRNKQYIEAFRELEKLVNLCCWNDECDKRLSEISKISIPAGLFFGPISNADRENFLAVKPPFTGGLRLFKKLGFDIDTHATILREKYIIKNETNIPRPERRHIDFDKPLMFLPRKQDYIIYKSFDDLLNSYVTSTRSPDSDSYITKPVLDRSDKDKDICYIRVNTNANMIDLKEDLLSDISTFLKKQKPRIRQRKWKYYLIVYDLKQESNDKMSFDEIAGILIGAYPGDEAKLFTETRNIINWYGKATSLINGDFIKYLKPTTLTTK